MTAREYRRVSGYVRANAKLDSAFRESGFVVTPEILRLRWREAHAWSRLPERARAAILNPAPEVQS